MKILLVEDDALLLNGLQKALVQQQYCCDVANSISEARRYTLNDYDLLILDLGLPDGDGLSLLKTWRQQGCVLPVLILTARDSLDDRVKGLDSGADDYLVKPFALAELQARVRALMRRRFEKTENALQFGSLKLDMNHHQVWQNGNELTLTRMEYAILRRLMLHAGKTVQRERLQQDLYDWTDEIGSNTLEVYIHHLRRKLGSNYIKTIRGEGYRLESQAE
ncbi:two-component system response regulator PmrA [Tolumonas lignilytica]|jgi:Response regulators consisting of a CheY-like receiver domain and a winged-helix DNA-binding domain|uniref:two-component system response regulator PmrA n=1 Tax=Tolumonas lignilytica TaxID=1283284 RepID=UPI000465EAA6|nr:two-component system response regulator PmrA [Tolumonas lignilytica]